jgi:hypothetical protein
MLLLYFYGPPFFWSAILATLLHLPFQPVCARSSVFKGWFIARLTLLLLSAVGLAIWYFSDAYPEITSSAFSPIGVSGEGLRTIRLTSGIVFFIFISITELNFVFVKRREQ